MSNYMNNSKVKNYPTSLMKIFFERNNKNVDTFSNLGNVFRNSKWSDLQVQNVKYSFTSQYAYILIIAISSLVLVKYFFSSNNIFIYDSISSVLDNVTIFINEFTFFISIIITSIYQSLLSLLYRKESGILGNVVVNNNYRLLNSGAVGSGIKPTVSKESFESNSDLLINVFSLTKDLNNIKDSEVINTYGLEYGSYLNFSRSTLMYPKLISNTSIGSDNTHNLQHLDLEFYIYSKLGDLNVTDYYNTTPYEVNKFCNDSRNIGNLSNNSNLSKQVRWMLKNSLVSENLVINNNNYLSSKRLINSNITNSNLNNTNINFSNFFNENSIDTRLGNYTIKNIESLSNYNFFEESREFLQKKYLFSINQRNLLINSSLDIVNTSTNKSIVPYTAKSYFDLYEYSNLNSNNLYSNQLLIKSNVKLNLENNLYKSNEKSTVNKGDYSLTTADNFNMFNSFILNLDNLSSSESNKGLGFTDSRVISKFPFQL